MNTRLTKFQDYAVWEPGMNEWFVMTHIGYDKLQDQYLFRSPEDDEFYMYIPGPDLYNDVKPLE